MSAKSEDAELILKLYELRREEVMREARAWFLGEFNPGSAQDIMDAVMSDKSAYFRMVTSYWEMAASLVNNGAIDEQMFNDANGEHLAVFAKIEPFLSEVRERFGSPQSMQHLERLVMRIPDAKERMSAFRERIKAMRAAREAAAAKSQAGA
ncbi:MAG TPA: hypothetical protein VF766_05080 [Pyrinomonadaceae bacterium]